MTISAAAKFLAVPMATFRDNKQALHGIFHYVLTTPNPPQNSTTITEEKYHRIVTHTQ